MRQEPKEFTTFRYLKDSFGEEVVTMAFFVNLSDPGNRYMDVGFAFCSVKDEPCRTTGREKALDRLEEDFGSFIITNIPYTSDISLVNQVIIHLMRYPRLYRDIIENVRKTGAYFSAFQHMNERD